MRTRYQILTLLAAIAAVTLSYVSADAQDSPGDVDLAQTLTELLPGMGADEMNARRESQAAWQAICLELGAPGNESRRAEACRLMAERIGRDTPIEARIWLLKQLERHGGGECVDAVAAQLNDEDIRVRDAARRSLANNSAAEAGESLRQAVTKTQNADDRIALIRALGYRAEPESVETLAALLDDQQQAVAIAAAQALASIGNSAAARRLSAAMENSAGELRLQFASALVRCAASLAQAGDVEQAKAIYEHLAKAESPLKAMGLAGLLAVSGDQAAAVLLSALQTDDEALHDVALRCAGELDSTNIAGVADGLSSLSPDVQVRILAVLASRGDRAALPGVLQAAESDDPAVKIAAIEALGGVGNGGSARWLIETVLAGGAAGEAARRALENFHWACVDEMLTHEMRQTEDPTLRASLIELLIRRRAVAVIPTLLEDLASDDGAVRSRALAGLGQLASADDVPKIIEELQAGPEKGLSDAAQRAIVDICRRAPVEADQADPVLKFYGGTDDARRIALLPLLGRIGGAKALTILRFVLESKDAAYVEAAVTALTNWPTAEVATELATLAETLDDEGQKIRAIRGLARVVVLQQTFTDAEELALLKRAMNQATRDDERRLILDRAREARSFETVLFAADFLDGDKRLVEQACRTIVDLLHRSEIRTPNAQESDKLLQRVIATTANEGLADDARKYLSGQ